MRALIFVITLSIASLSQANEMQFSDLSNQQQQGILTGLKKFLPMYQNALQIALHNVQVQSVGTMNAGGPMSEIVLEQGTAQGLFAKVGKMVSSKISMENFGDMRGQQSFTQANKEAAQAESLSFHVHHFHKYNDLGFNAKRWMKHMNSQVKVVSADESGAVVRLLNFPRNCTITANSSAQVYQHCN